MMRKITFLAFLGMALSSCISNRILSFEDDDVYFVPADKVTEEEMDEYLEKKAEEERTYYDY